MTHATLRVHRVTYRLVFVRTRPHYARVRLPFAAGLDSRRANKLAQELNDYTRDHRAYFTCEPDTHPQNDMSATESA